MHHSPSRCRCRCCQQISKTIIWDIDFARSDYWHDRVLSLQILYPCMHAFESQTGYTKLNFIIWTVVVLSKHHFCSHNSANPSSSRISSSSTVSTSSSSSSSSFSFLSSASVSSSSSLSSLLESLLISSGLCALLNQIDQRQAALSNMTKVRLPDWGLIVLIRMNDLDPE
jgi:hypothetical protein